MRGDEVDARKIVISHNSQITSVNEATNARTFLYTFLYTYTYE